MALPQLLVHVIHPLFVSNKLEPPGRFLTVNSALELALCSAMAIVKTAPICPGHHDWNRLPKEIKPDTFRSSSQMAKMVCVTNGTSFLGLWIVRQLLLRGYMVRVTVHNTGELQRVGEMEEFALYSANNKLTGVVANVVSDSTAALCEAFDGCYGVFHTSSFIDPHGLSGYTEHMVNLEVKGAEKTVEACCMTSSVRRCVFTSSLTACVWQRYGFNEDCEFVVDEKCWSDQHLCREKKLWLALSKTMSEKAAWRVAEERGGVNLVTLCPALLTGPAFSASCASSAVAYLKGAREMYERNLLATVDVRRAAEAHVCVYEEMEIGGSGRYICFDKVITRPEDARDLEKKLNMGLGFSADENSEENRSSQYHIGSHRIFNAKLRRILDLSASGRSCRRESE